MLVTNNNPGPPACQLQGSFPPSPSFCQVIPVHGGNTGHRLSRGQKFWAAASNLTRESKRHRTTGAKPPKGPRGSCQLQPSWVSSVVTSAGALLKARDCMQQASIRCSIREGALVSSDLAQETATYPSSTGVIHMVKGYPQMRGHKALLASLSRLLKKLPLQSNYPRTHSWAHQLYPHYFLVQNPCNAPRVALGM